MPFLDFSQLGQVIDTRQEDEKRANCPYCSDEGFHLYLHTRKRVFHCFRCGSKGKHNYSSDRGNLQSAFEADDARATSERGPLQLPRRIRGGLTIHAERYLAKRGLLESDCIRHKIYCADTRSIYFGRIIVPCNPSYDKCDYFTARAYTRIGWPKYLNPPGGKSRLYVSPTKPDDEFDQYWQPHELLLVEGPFDMLKASRHGPCAALLGKQLSVPVAKEIIAKYEKVYIMLDNGIPETAAAMQIENQLSLFVETQIFKCPKKDPGEMEPEDFEELFL